MPYKDPLKRKEMNTINSRRFRNANPDYTKAWNSENKEKLVVYRQKYRKKNHDKILSREKQWRDKNREKLRETSRKFGKSQKRIEWREKTSEKRRIQRHQKYEENKEIIKEKVRLYRLKNSLKVKEMQHKNYQEHKLERYDYTKKKRKENIAFLIRCRLATNLWTAMKKYSATGKIWKARCYGIDYKSIVEHLKPFPEDTSKYHIDHIRPLCSFKFIKEDGSTDFEEIKQAFAPENHQWLTARENLKKGRRYYG